MQQPATPDTITLDIPEELGLTWDDGDDLLALTGQTITLYPHGADEFEMTAAEAREMAAHLAAMADALDAATGTPS